MGRALTILHIIMPFIYLFILLYVNITLYSQVLRICKIYVLATTINLLKSVVSLKK